jgi:Ycf66 protein N-terminus
MLAYILAVLVGIGSIGLYIAAFFFPEIHRKYDFIWSGVGCFYALALWIYARQEVGGILVGQTASVALLGWFGWQTIQMRRQLSAIERQTSMSSTKPNRNDRKQSVPTTTKPTADRQNVPAKPAATVTATPATSTTERPPASTKNLPVANSTPQPSNSPPSRPIVTVTSSAPTSPAERPPAIEKTTSTANSAQQPANPKPPAANPPTVAPVANTIPTDRSPANVKTVPGESNVAPATQAISQSIDSTPTAPETPPPQAATTPAAPQAWIKMEVKPAPASKPLGTPAQPPATPPPSTTVSKPEAASPPEIVTEPIAEQNVPSDATQTTAKLEESQNWD